MILQCPRPAIRSVRPEDCQSLTELALTSKAFWEYSEEFIRDCKAVLTITPQMITDWFNGVIEEDGEPAGFYFLSIEGKQAELELLYVSPIAMGKGYGKVLFQTAERLAVEHGCFCLRIEADPNAVGFYKRMGARQTGWARSEVDDVRELPLMEKNLCKV